jgi:hypothetical protein
VVAVAFDFAGGRVDVAGTWLLFFLFMVLVVPAMTLYFNRSINHDSDWVDERWGDGSIDDDDWGLAVTTARTATNSTLCGLAERADSHT